MRTINRSPMTVGIPDIKYKYFNHYNWKGLNTNKNYFDIDPETFEDCQDVYVDENGVLKSRPSVKILEDGLTGIIDAWLFGDIKVYRTVANLYVSQPSYDVASYELSKDVKLKLLRFDDKLLLFTPDVLLSYKEGVIQEATDLIYVPETTIYVNGIKSDTSESKNILTKKEATTYLYNKVDSIYAADFYDKIVDIKINNELYENVVFKAGMENVLFDRKFKLNEKNYSPKGFLGEYTEGVPLISVREYTDLGVTVTLLQEVSNVGENLYNEEIYYSLDNLIFHKLPHIEGFYSTPYLAEEYPYIIVIKQDGLYCISTVESDKYSYYSDWTKFADTKISINDYNNILNEDECYKKNNTVSGCFFNLSNFVYSFAYNTSVYFVSRINDVDIVETYTSDDNTILNQPIALAFKYDGIDAAFFTCQYFILKSSVNKNISYKTVSGVLTKYKLSAESYNYRVYEDVLTSGTDIHLTQFKYNMCMTKPVITSLSFGGIVDKGNIVRIFTINRVLFDAEGSKLYSSSRQYAIYEELLFWIVAQGQNTRLKNFSTTRDEYIFALSSTIITSNTKYRNITLADSTISFNKEMYPLSVQDNLYICNTYDSQGDKYFYSSDTSTNNIQITFTNDGAMENVDFTDLVYLNAVYGAIGNKLHISEGRYDEDGNLLLYFPEYNKHTFAENINKLHPISSSQVAIFFDDEIYYSDIQSINDKIVYTVNKSKLSVGCKNGDDVVTTFDGKYVIFPSQRGLVAMGYQDFIASTEQTLTYLSDNILDRFSKFINKPTKLYLYKYWLACYNEDGVYLLDFRNLSWWYFNYKNITRVNTSNYKPLIVANGREFELDTSSSNYYDNVWYKEELSEEELDKGTIPIEELRNVVIEWSLTSQKLHLGTLNNTKQIVNIALNSLQESDEPMTMKLNTIDYRTSYNDEAEQTLQYGIKVLRTFVKKLNHMKVNQFQYKLSYDDDNAMSIPLNVDNISIKYKITGQVR